MMMRRSIPAMLLSLGLTTLALGQENIPPPPEMPPIATSLPPAPPSQNIAIEPLAQDLGGNFGGMFSPHLGNAVPKISFQTRWFPDADVRGQGTSLGFWSQAFSLGAPLWQDSNHELSFTAGIKEQHAFGTAILPTSGVVFPADLWNLRLGLGYRQSFDNGWIAGINASLGSASDVPFHSVNELSVNLHAFLRIPVRETDAWLLSLSYSPTGELSFPMPGVAYHWVPNEQFQALIGIPLSITVRPTEDWSFHFTYTPITNVKARVDYRLTRGLKLYASYDWTNDSYYRSDRTDDRARLFIYDMRLTTGIQYSVNSNFSIDLFGGYSFNRYIFEGRSLSDRNNDRINLDDTPFVGASATFRW